MPSYSGVVIAGFGAKDIYPSLIAYHIEGLINDTLRWTKYGDSRVDRDNSAEVVAFAQAEMVHMFMNGIDPSYITFLRQYLTSLFNKYPEEFAKKLPKLTAREKATVVNRVKQQGNVLIGDLFSAIDRYSAEKHVSPVIEAVEFLPITELASMAESLVNLTSFKRRVTMVAETVGGPIDVAVISKGDGFIWIKRKHYFDRDPNQHFYANYYR
jgi:hypothetical protein